MQPDVATDGSIVHSYMKHRQVGQAKLTVLFCTVAGFQVIE